MQGFTLHHNNIIRLIIARILLQKRMCEVSLDRKYSWHLYTCQNRGLPENCRKGSLPQR